MISLLRSPIFLVGAMTLPVGLVAILREALTSRFFGTTWAVDAFTAAQALALFLVTVAGSTLGAVSVPEVARLSSKHGHQGAKPFAYTFLALGMLKLFGLSLIIALVAPLYLGMIGAHFDRPTTQLAIDLVQIFALYFFFSAMSAQVSALLNYLDSYAAPALSHVLIPGMACMALVAFQAADGIKPLAWAVVIGSAVQFVLLALMLVKTLGIPQISLPLTRGLLARLVKEYCPLAFGAALMGVTPFVDLQMAAKVGPGSVAALAYGALIPMLAAGFLARVIAGPALSLFSKQVAHTDFTSAIKTLNRYVWLCLVITAIPTALLISLTPFLVELLFMHGVAIADDARIIGQVQRLLALQIPFYAASIIAVRMLTALQMNRLIMSVAAANLSLKIALNSAFLPHLGVAGIALSTSVVYIFSLCCLWSLAVAALSRERDAVPAKG